MPGTEGVAHSSSFQKYVQVAGRATRQALKEEERLKSEKRGTISLKWQEWKDGKGGVQASFPVPLRCADLCRPGSCPPSRRRNRALRVRPRPFAGIKERPCRASPCPVLRQLPPALPAPPAGLGNRSALLSSDR